MAVECRLTKSRKLRWVLYLVLCVGFAAYCAYDGWISEKFKDDPGNLLFNQVGAVCLAGLAVVLIIGFVKINGTRVVADETGIDVNGKLKIKWSDLTGADDSGYEKGLVTVFYKQDGNERKYVIDNYKIDHFEELLDEISSRRPDVLPPAEEQADSEQDTDEKA